MAFGKVLDGCSSVEAVGWDELGRSLDYLRMLDGERRTESGRCVTEDARLWMEDAWWKLMMTSEGCVVANV